MRKSEQIDALAAASQPKENSYSLDCLNQQLWCGETAANVPPKVFQLLVYLRDNPGRIIDYDELLDAVWPREAVQPEILKTYIKTIRRLLGDDPHHPTFIETRMRCGYRFIGKLPDRCNDTSSPAERLIGREDAMKTLRRGFGIAMHGRRQVVFVVGEAGIGKTRLLDEFVTWTTEQNIIACRIECASVQHGTNSISLIEDLAQELLRQIQLLDPVDGEASLPDVAQLCSASDPNFSQTVLHAIETLSAKRTVVLTLEDIQWADPLLISLLSRLARGRSSARLMIVATHRAAMPKHFRDANRTMIFDLVVHGAAQEIRLPKLSNEDIKRYILSQVTVPMGKGSIEAISTYSTGNPLIMSTLVTRMVEEIRVTGKSVLIDMLSQSEAEGEFLVQAVPKIIRQSLALQLGQLGEQACSVLESGSTSGYSFCAWGVAKALDVDQIQIEDLCRSMCGSDQLLREAGVYIFPDGSVTPVYSFRNRLHARLLLAAQSHSRREHIHQRFINAVEECWGDEIGSVAIEMTERFTHVHEWSRALHYAKLAVINAKQRTSRDDTRSLLEKGLSIAIHLPEELRAQEKNFFLRQLSELS
jgi:DNA-binding winged helix-turn-helix (wHTH) protein